jgi:hypothetical protein
MLCNTQPRSFSHLVVEAFGVITAFARPADSATGARSVVNADKLATAVSGMPPDARSLPPADMATVPAVEIPNVFQPSTNEVLCEGIHSDNFARLNLSYLHSVVDFSPLPLHSHVHLHTSLHREVSE